MGTVLTGNAANILTPLTATVAGTSSGTGGNVRIQTSAPFVAGVGDDLTIGSVGGTTEANGQHAITAIIDSTHFEIGVTWVHAWTSGGTVTDESLSPPMLVPSDGDPASAQLSGLISSQQSILDRTQFLQKEIIRTVLPKFPASGYYLFTVTPTLIFTPGSGWGQVAAYSHTTAASTGPVEQISVVAAVGDVIEVSAVVNMSNSNVSLGATYVNLEYAENFPGGTGVTTTPFIQSEAQAQLGGGSQIQFLSPIPLQGVHTVSAAGPLAIFLNGHATAPGSQGDWVPATIGSVIVKQWRPFP